MIIKEYWPFLQTVMAVLGEYQNALVLANVDTKKIRNVMRKTCAVRRRICLLKDVKTRKRFEEKVIEFVHVGVPNLWGYFKDGVLCTCDEVCARKMG